MGTDSPCLVLFCFFLFFFVSWRCDSISSKSSIQNIKTRHLGIFLSDNSIGLNYTPVTAASHLYRLVFGFYDKIPWYLPLVFKTRNKECILGHVSRGIESSMVGMGWHGSRSRSELIEFKQEAERTKLGIRMRQLFGDQIRGHGGAVWSQTLEEGHCKGKTSMCKGCGGEGTKEHTGKLRAYKWRCSGHSFLRNWKESGRMSLGNNRKKPSVYLHFMNQGQTSSPQGTTLRMHENHRHWECKV